MNGFRFTIIFLLFCQVTSGQVKHTFSKLFSQPGVGDWIQFGQIDHLPSGTFVNIKVWAHYNNQLFFEEFEVAATSYGNPNLDWVEVAPKLTNSYSGVQSFALDVNYKCVHSCPLVMRLRRLSGGSSSGWINFIVESNSGFSELSIEGKSGVVSAGFLGNNGGYKFPVSNSTFNASEQGLFINPTGDIGVGTINTGGYKFAVAGNMIAESVKVQLKGSWPDYVFDKSYYLPDLQEVEKHIREKGHLPGIPSAADVRANGIDLGEINAKLLQQIEELTLHLIQKDKEIKNLQNLIERIVQLENKIDKISRERFLPVPQ